MLTKIYWSIWNTICVSVYVILEMCIARKQELFMMISRQINIDNVTYKMWFNIFYGEKLMKIMICYLGHIILWAAVMFTLLFGTYFTTRW